MEQIGEVAVLGGRDAIVEAIIKVVGRIEPVPHALSEKGGLATTKSKVLRVPLSVLEVRVR
jgi:hypothetical protein